MAKKVAEFVGGLLGLWIGFKIGMVVFGLLR